MDVTAFGAAIVDTKSQENGRGVVSKSTFSFLELPRELRDQIYDYVFHMQDNRGERALRIERRNLKYFTPSAAAILLVLHHEYFLLSRQVAREALEVLFKNHTVFLSCGPFVLKSLLERIEEQNGPGRQWLRWIKKVELDWVTFPNLRCYPPDREEGRDEWWWEHDGEGVDVDYVRGAQYNGHYDEHDYEGGHYDDNFYDPIDASLYPSFRQPIAPQTTDANDIFGFANHYPFSDPSREPTHDSSTQEDISTKLDLLVSMEVTPLFTYLSSSAFSLTSITVPLYFISRESHRNRSITRPGYALPLKIRYWVQVCVHALLMLTSTSSLQEVHVKYLPWDIWASMDPADNLRRITEKGVWFDEMADGQDDEREGEGEAFRAVWAGLAEKGQDRLGLCADVKFISWDGNVDSYRIGDEVEVVFTKNAE
ncbi:hypothetical protein P153DRAFT_333089 [Dothidotthia symphoricarpi CBS 119687]|uniref:Uncharacterized protein n=1 Tax=Dothidotthia symphoricarpi CBS 119687 TaxID=1392245 RepID=A0A6A6ANX8_9PLEO|nr:uncharacterized protein P153DRAFT_333089 [Dothidotthia symphoricarpi CBS 119687]KAF2132644.1 hypothetical protein P153DRAFT_333089 [Dothidotthia symphoricarpi CBS 119687]